MKGGGTNAVSNGQATEVNRRVFSETRPSLCDTLIDRCEGLHAASSQRVFHGHGQKMGRQSFLKVPPEGRGGGKDAAARAKGQDTVAIHLIESNRQLPRRRCHHPGQEKCREGVGYDQRSSARKSFEQARTVSLTRLEVSVVTHTSVATDPGVFQHAIEYKLVKTITSPPISNPQRFEYQ